MATITACSRCKLCVPEPSVEKHNLHMQTAREVASHLTAQCRWKCSRVSGNAQGKHPQNGNRCLGAHARARSLSLSLSHASRQGPTQTGASEKEGD